MPSVRARKTASARWQTIALNVSNTNKGHDYKKKVSYWAQRPNSTNGYRVADKKKLAKQNRSVRPASVHTAPLRTPVRKFSKKYFCFKWAKYRLKNNKKKLVNDIRSIVKASQKLRKKSKRNLLHAKHSDKSKKYQILYMMGCQHNRPNIN